MIKLHLCLAAIITSFNPISAHALESVSRDMSFENCLELIRQYSAQIGVAPTNLVETEILRIVRYPAQDGSVLVTCSKLDEKLTITEGAD